MRLPQNNGSVSPAFIAPGITSMTRLSTISMTVIDSVSDAKATVSATPNSMPPRSIGSNVIR